MSTITVSIICLLVFSNTAFITLFVKYWELFTHYKLRYEDAVNANYPNLDVQHSKIKRIKFERRYQRDVFDALEISDPKRFVLRDMTRYWLLEVISDFLVFNKTYDALNDEYCFYGYLEVVDNDNN